MNKEQKSAVVDEIAEQIQGAEAIFAVDYRGISVAQVAELRGKLREVDARFRVVKNSLSERAADKAGLESLKPMLVGPTALALVKGDAALAAKALNDAARMFQLLDFKGGVLNGTVLTADDVRSIARLPSRDVLNAQLVGTIAAPLSGLVRTLNALIAGVAIQLQAIADQGLVSGEAPATEPQPEAPAAEPEAAAEPEIAAAEPETADAEPETVAPEPEAEAVAPEPQAEPEAEAAAPEPQAAAAPAEPEAAAAAESEATPEPQPDTEPQAASDAVPSDD